MKRTLLFGFLLMSAGCADLNDASLNPPADERTVPKSYDAPTTELLGSDEGWSFVGAIDIDGDTLMGSTSEFVAFDTFLAEGSELSLYAWSDGWASLNIFGAQPGSGQWSEVEVSVLSSPVDPEVEAGQTVFTPPFEGHYLFLIGPVMNEEIQYLLRLNCNRDCP